MRIQVASDLHLEFLTQGFPGYRLVEPAGADVLVLAGDIHAAAAALRVFADWPVPVDCIAGNHEYYRADLGTLEPAFAAGPKNGQARMLESRVWEYRGTRFVGATLWTDYALYGDVDAAMAHAQALLMDHRAIRMGDRPFLPGDALALHRRTRAWLEETLATPFSGPTVVCTHHGPHRHSIHTDYEDDPVNPGFLSDLSDLLGLADLWIHGHVHNSFDYRVQGCRVVANPRGYALNRREVTKLSDLVWENPRFDPRLVVEV